MAETTGIAWTDHTHNEWWGCSSPAGAGCDNCLDPETLILMSDMSWKKLLNIEIGDVVYGFDEEQELGATRLMRKSVVLNKWRVKDERILFRTKQGREIICSPDHRFLSVNANKSVWIKAQDLKLDSKLRIVCHPILKADVENLEYQSGYIAGVSAGDGTFRFDKNWRSDKLGFPAMYWRVAVAETDKSILDRLVKYLGNIGVCVEIRNFSGGSSGAIKGSKPMLKVETRSKKSLQIIDDLLKNRTMSQQWCRGWLAGFLDTDGCASGSMRKNGLIHRWSQAVNRNDYLSLTLECLTTIGFVGVLEKGVKIENVRLCVSNISERLEFISAILPALPRKGVDRLYGNENLSSCRASRHPNEIDEVVYLEKLSSGGLIDITTSTATFIANGISTHNCYAAALDNRFGGNHFGIGTLPRMTKEQNRNNPYRWDRAALASGERKKVFCGSMMDFFDKLAPVGGREAVYNKILQTKNLDWQILTKRPSNIMKMLPANWADGYENVWLGTTVENRKSGLRRLEQLRDIPAKVRFLSIEPLLENLGDVDFSGISWVIIGGESGAGFRFMDREWVISLLAQCREQGIPVFFKQWGGTASDAGGCLLDGLEIKEFPIWYESRKSLSSSDLLSV